MRTTVRYDTQPIGGQLLLLGNKRSVLRRQSRDTSRNIKKVCVLPIRIV